MTRAQLVERKLKYEKIKSALENQDFSVEIEAELQKYRDEITKKYEESRANDIKRADHYLELLDDLIEDATREEINSSQASTNESTTCS